MDRIVVPFGFYGAGNIGDEATLGGFVRLLALAGRPAKVTAGSRNPRHTASIEPSLAYFHATRRDPRLWWARWRATAVAFAGGTPIQDILGDWPLREVLPGIRLARRGRLPIAFIGVGIEDLRLASSRQAVASEIVPFVDCWSVRSPHDAERLRALGVPDDRLVVASDMAWLLDPVATAAGRAQLDRWQVPPDRPLIGVNLANENACFDRLPALAAEIAAALDGLVERVGAHVVFLANETRPDEEFDTAAARRVLARMARRDRASMAPPAYLAPREMMSIVANCALTISMRYHFCLFSALQRTPFVGIERSSKVRDLCRDLSWEASMPLDALQRAPLLQHAWSLLQPDAAVLSTLDAGLSSMRTRARANQKALAVLLADTRWQGSSQALGGTR